MFLAFCTKTEHESTTQKHKKHRIHGMVYLNTVPRTLLKTNLQWAKEKNTMWKITIELTNLTDYN